MCVVESSSEFLLEILYSSSDLSGHCSLFFGDPFTYRPITAKIKGNVMPSLPASLNEVGGAKTQKIHCIFPLDSKLRGIEGSPCKRFREEKKYLANAFVSLK